MYPFLMIVILLTLCIGEASSPALLDAPRWRLGGVAVLVFAHCLLLECSGRRLMHLLHTWPQHASRWGRRLQLLRSTHINAWLLLVFTLLAALQWHHLALDYVRLRDVPLLGDVALLLPILIPLVWGWAVVARFEAAVEQLIATRDTAPQTDVAPFPRLFAPGSSPPRPALAESLAPINGPPVWRVVWRRQCRARLGPILLPLLIVFAAGDALKHSDAPLHTVQFLTPVLLLGLIAMATPYWLSRIWETRPLDHGPLRSRLESLTSRLGLKVRRLLVWSTGDKVANAAVAGAFGPWKTIYLSDRLLQQLDPPHIEAVLCHEAGHIQRRHLLVRLLALSLPLGLLLLLPTVAQQLGAALSQQLANQGISRLVQLGVLLPVAACGYAAVVVLIASWLIEFDADLWAVAHLDSAEQLETALQRLAEASPGVRRASWLHPSMEHRVRLIRWAAAHPEAATRAQAIASGLSKGLAIVGVAIVCLQLTTLLG